MDEEFKLCWKNFQDNIASGFQNLYDRGDLVDVTLACDGKLLHAHKIVLAICSPYFQEIFATNPCKHPIIILKDVTFNIMCELLEFMYQGVVNVKQAELQSFMKIGQLLQIKGLATNSSSSPASTSSEKSNSQIQNVTETNQNNEKNDTNPTVNDEKSNSHIETNNDAPISSTNISNTTTNRSRSPSASTTQTAFPSGLGQQNLKSGNSSPIHHAAYHAANAALKRQSDFLEASPLFSVKKHIRRSLTTPSDQNSDLSDANESGTGMDSMSTDDFLLPSISMVESRYDLNNLKREGANSDRDYRENAAAVALRNTFGAPFGFDYNLYKNSSNTSSAGGSSGSGAGVPQAEYPNDLHMPNDYSKNFGNHMEIPSIAPGEHWFQGNLEFMLSQRGKPLLVHDGHTFGIQYVRKDKKYWQCNLSRKYNCKARVTTTETGDIIVTNNEHCHTEIRQHLRKDYQRQKVMMNALINLSTNHLAQNLRRQQQQQQQQHHHHQVNNLNNICTQLQQTLTAPPIQQQQPLGTPAMSPIAAHTATSSAASVQRLLDLGKLSTNDQVLNAVLQKQQEDAEENMPLDCGIRSVLSDDTNNENLKGLSLTKTESVDKNNEDNETEKHQNFESALPNQG